MRRLIVLLSFSIFASLPLLAQRPQEARSSAEIHQAMEKLGVVGNVLFIAAHPDDENTALLSYLASERKLRTGYLSITRGDGGQNLIGDEKGALLGLIRTQELLAARRVDGAEQFFTRAVDFGYSKSPEETFAVWKREAILGDVVYLIRKFRPDVIITRFPTTGEGGHGQHTASALLVVEAFSAAADPKRFPEQLFFLKTWQTRRIFWNAFRPQQGGPPLDDPQFLRIDIGSYNKVLGRAYSEIAAESRTMHKSQGFGSAERRGSILNYFKQLGGDPVVADLFEGLDLTWSRIEGGSSVAPLIEKAIATYNPESPADSLPVLQQALSALEKIPANVWTNQKHRELVQLMRDAGGIWLESIATSATAAPGGSITVNTTVIPRAIGGVRVESIAFADEAGRTVPHAATVDAKSPVETNKALTIEAKLTLPETIEATHPYWLETPGPDRAHYPAAGLDVHGSHEEPASITANVILSIGETILRYEVPVLYRWTDRVEGEKYRPFGVTPILTAAMSDAVVLFPAAEAKTVDVAFQNRGTTAIASDVSLKVGSGWKVAPASQKLQIDPRGESKVLRFTVTPPKEESETDFRVTLGGKEAAKSLVVIDYDHIPTQLLAPVATGTLVRADVRRRGEKIGYIEGAGDEVAEALEQIGYRVVALTDADIESGDLGSYDAIVAGVRAFNTRDVLKRSIDRIFTYVENGGTFLAQYNTNDDTMAKRIAPYELVVSRDRVTVEEAPVTFLDPADPLLNAPNRITSADFNGWIQERGLYFPNKWGKEFRPLLSMNDPGEKPMTGSVVVANYGKGVFIYTGLAFFRQLPEGVPGAYRFLANLVSARQATSGKE